MRAAWVQANCHATLAALPTAARFGRAKSGRNQCRRARDVQTSHAPYRCVCWSRGESCESERVARVLESPAWSQQSRVRSRWSQDSPTACFGSKASFDSEDSSTPRLCDSETLATSGLLKKLFSPLEVDPHLHRNFHRRAIQQRLRVLPLAHGGDRRQCEILLRLADQSHLCDMAVESDAGFHFDGTFRPDAAQRRWVVRVGVADFLWRHDEPSCR